MLHPYLHVKQISFIVSIKYLILCPTISRWNWYIQVVNALCIYLYAQDLQVNFFLIILGCTVCTYLQKQLKSRLCWFYGQFDIQNKTLSKIPKVLFIIQDVERKWDLDSVCYFCSVLLFLFSSSFLLVGKVLT